MAETITFKGVVFRRYPKSKNWPDKWYFTPGISDRQNGWRRLHEEVWIAQHGAIPSGHEIHHVDFDPLNNDVANLACLTVEQHNDAHRERWSAEGKARGWPEACREAAAAWHGSAEGREWHAAHGRATWEGVEQREEKCDQCGATYLTRARGSKDRFCTNNCKSAWRRASGVDDVDRECAVCGVAFRVNRYARTRTCGRACGRRLVT